MAKPVSDSVLSQALLDTVRGNSYPDEDVVSSKFPASAVPGTLELIKDVKKDVEV